MAIDKEGSGIPEFDVHRRTTKVNLAMIIGVAAFLLIGVGAIAWFVLRST